MKHISLLLQPGLLLFLFASLIIGLANADEGSEHCNDPLFLSLKQAWGGEWHIREQEQQIAHIDIEPASLGCSLLETWHWVDPERRQLAMIYWQAEPGQWKRLQFSKMAGDSTAYTESVLEKLTEDGTFVFQVVGKPGEQNRRLVLKIDPEQEKAFLTFQLQNTDLHWVDGSKVLLNKNPETAVISESDY